MNALALIIGNCHYPNNKLKNPVNDAVDLEKVLKRLGFFTSCHTDLKIKELDHQIGIFGTDLETYDIGLFYFAGHGLQIEGENFLTAIDTNFKSETDAKFSSVTINKVLSYMERSKSSTNILILDACRNNPYERAWSRSINQKGLAPMHAPKGTLIAYATSPGQTASDGKGRNGLYTESLLRHIEEENIGVEELFKKVRNSVYTFSGGKQTSWEHTSLTGGFKFNAGQLSHSLKNPYNSKVVADKNYKIKKGDVIGEIVNDLKSKVWQTQKPAVKKALTLDPTNINKNSLFLIGRNLLQTAVGGEFEAQKLMNNLPSRLRAFSFNDQNHILNGMLFEIYFDSNGKIRSKKLKSDFISQMASLEEMTEFKSSFKFIKKQLKPFEKDLFYIPGSTDQHIGFDILLRKQKNKNESFEYYIQDIKHEGKSVLVNDNRNPFFGSNDEPYFEPLPNSRLINKISELSSIPSDRLKLNINYQLTENAKLRIPFGYIIQKAI